MSHGASRGNRTLLNALSHTDDRNERRWDGFNVRPLTTSRTRLELSYLRKAGLFEDAARAALTAQDDSGSRWVIYLKTTSNTIEYRHEIDDAPHSSGEIRLERKAIPRGNTRLLMRCPSCRDRRTVLYLDPTGAEHYPIACRQCYRLAYPTQRMTKAQRMESRAHRLTYLLEWDDDGEPVRPRGMWLKTFERILCEIAAFDDAAEQARQEAIANSPLPRYWQKRFTKRE